MKKLALVLAIVLMCSLVLAGCSQKEAYDLYMDMNEAMLGVTSSDVSADVNMKMTAAGESFDISMKMDIQQITRSETDIDMKMDITMGLGELGAMMGMEEIVMNMYFTDGNMYYDMMGQKMKIAMDLESAMEMMGVGDVGAMSIDFDKESIAESSVKSVGDDKELSFVLRGEMLSNVIDQMVGSMMQNMGLGDDMQISFGDVSYTALIGKDSLPKTEHMVFSMNMDIMGESATADYDMFMTNHSFNSIDVIEFPDFSDYLEVDASLMGMM